MSFTQNIKAQLAEIENECDFCDIAELSAICKVCTTYRDDGVSIVTENEDVADKIQRLFARVFSVEIDRVVRNGTFKFDIDGDFFADTMALRLMIFNLDDAEVTPYDCCREAYIRGTFLGGGSMSDPKVRYHMEFDCRYESYANQLRDMLGEVGIVSKITCRKGRFIVYIKDYESIADILGVMGDVSASMELYNISIEKEIRNTINRQQNCELANIDKVTKTAQLQIECIKKVEKHLGFDNLPETLREIAKVRMAYPEDSLKELGDRLNPPIGKSGVNHRLKRIIEISEKYN